MMRNDLKMQAQIEKTVIQVLEHKPDIAMPEDFAARIAQSMPAKLPARAHVRPVFGRMAAYLAIVAMTVVLALLTWAHPEALAVGRGFLFGVELLLVAQLLAVGFWLGMRSDN